MKIIKLNNEWEIRENEDRMELYCLVHNAFVSTVGCHHWDPDYYQTKIPIEIEQKARFILKGRLW